VEREVESQLEVIDRDGKRWTRICERVFEGFLLIFYSGCTFSR